MDPIDYLKDVIAEFKSIRNLAEKAMAQVSDEQFFKLIDDEANSIALIVKHISGNMRSRWLDFLTTDGEKDDRNRDTEFIITEDDSREAIMERWENGWKILFDTLESLTPDDLGKTIYIRGNPGKVFSAIHRQIAHYGYHVGQITLLAKHFKNKEWQTLSIPKGKSEEFKMKKLDSFKNRYK